MLFRQPLCLRLALSVREIICSVLTMRRCRGWVHTCEPRSHGQTDRREIISIKTNKEINPWKQCNIGFISPSSITKQFYPSITQHKASRLGLFNIWLFIRTIYVDRLWVFSLREEPWTIIDLTPLHCRGEERVPLKVSNISLLFQNISSFDKLSF